MVYAMAFDGSRLQYYLDREREIREIAERCHIDTIREQLLRVADEYAALARQIKTGLLPPG
jgi:hypothetical protein